MRTAYLFAERSTCERGKVGAVLAKDDRIIATGYNGAPPGMPHCLDVGCEELILYEQDSGLTAAYREVNLGCQRTVHAEANVVAYAARHGIATEGSCLYCTHSPCVKCSQLMASAGIKHVVYDKKYRATPWDMLQELGIDIEGREYA